MKFIGDGTPDTADDVRAEIAKAKVESRLLLVGGRSRHWGKGFATEAANEMIRYAFGVVGVSCIYAVANPANQRSISVMQRLGMRSLGLQHHYGALTMTYALENRGE